MISPLFCSARLSIYLWIYVWPLSSDSLIYSSMLKPVTEYLNYNEYISINILMVSPYVLLQERLGSFWLFDFHIYCRIKLSSSTKKMSVGILIWIVIKSIDQFGEELTSLKCLVFQFVNIVYLHLSRPS